MLQVIGDKYALTPPMICTDKSPLEVVGLLKSLWPGHPLVMSFDATDFTNEGKLASAVECRSALQQELLIRTNFESFQKHALFFCRQHGIKAHLTAQTSPFVLAARDVKLFRGSYEDGYPFLSDQEQISMNIVASARNSDRVRMMKKENFLLKQDQDACSDRLTLLALAAISIAEEEHLENDKLRQKPEPESIYHKKPA